MLQCLLKLRICKQTSSRPSAEAEGHPITALTYLNSPINYQLINLLVVDGRMML